MFYLMVAQIVFHLLLFTFRFPSFTFKFPLSTFVHLICLHFGFPFPARRGEPADLHEVLYLIVPDMALLFLFSDSVALLRARDPNWMQCHFISQFHYPFHRWNFIDVISSMKWWNEGVELGSSYPPISLLSSGFLMKLRPTDEVPISLFS